MKLEHFKSFFILAYISGHPNTTFMELRKTFNLSDGSLSNFTIKLEKDELITTNKQIIDRKPRTTYEITHKGKFIIQDFINILNMHKS